MKEQSEIIITEKGVYKKINSKGKANHKKNEKEVTVDGLGRIQLERNILNKMNIKYADKLEIYESGRNIILKKANIKRDASRKTKIYVDNEYEIKIEISNIKFNTNHKITTVDEVGRILIWREIREKLGILENDKLKVYIKNDIIILIQKRR